MASKKELYGWVRIAGMISFIPIVLVAGPLAGYLAGEFLVSKFSFPSWVLMLCVGSGILASGLEVARIIRLTLKLEQRN